MELPIGSSIAITPISKATTNDATSSVVTLNRNWGMCLHLYGGLRNPVDISLKQTSQRKSDAPDDVSGTSHTLSPEQFARRSFSRLQLAECRKFDHFGTHNQETLYRFVVGIV